MKNRINELLSAEMAEDFPVNIVIEPSLQGSYAALTTTSPPLIVCDTTTYKVLGGRLERELSAPCLILEDACADKATVERINRIPYESLLAVGSGTINDLCKYASFLAGKSYSVCPTAPSMNGYLSANASITVKGQKQTLGAHLPRAVFCDLSILAQAPRRMIQAGLGDSLCSCTAQADWLLSHLLLDTPYNPLPFTLLAPYENELFTHSDKLLTGDKAVIDLLLRTLLASGIGMTLAGGSYPASQGEHSIAHTMEMKHGYALPFSFHGEQIGITTLIMAGLQEKIMAGTLAIAPFRSARTELHSCFDTALGETLYDASRIKFRRIEEKMDVIQKKIAQESSRIKSVLHKAMRPAAELRHILLKAGAPVKAEMIGWSEKELVHATTIARFTRDRFTFLDLVSQ